MRDAPLRRRWAERVASEVYRLRDGADLEALALSPQERALAEALRAPCSFVELCRATTIDPDAVRRLLRRLRGAGVLRNVSNEHRAESGTVEVVPAGPDPAVGRYSLQAPTDARVRVAGAAERAVRARAAPGVAERERRGHETQSGVVRRFLDSVRFKR